MSRKPYPDSAAAAERPWRSGGKNGFRTNESPENGTCRPNVMARPVARPRAVRLGRYSSASAARRTLSLVSGATGRFPEYTWETVVIDTPARRATSWIVAIDGPPMRHPARGVASPPAQFDAKALCPYVQPMTYSSVASFTGAECFEFASSVLGEGFACQGNIMATDRVVPAMAEAFGAAGGPLAERLLEALGAAQREGGDRRGQESAVLLVAKPDGGYGGNHDRYIDLRVDHHDRPIEELGRLFDLHRLYLQRPSEDEVVPVDSKLEAEIGRHLTHLGKRSRGKDLWDALFDYMGWENLEVRWVGKGRIDQKVLDYLGQHARGRGGP